MLPLKYRTWILKKCLRHEVYVSPSNITGNEVSIRFKQIDKDKIIIDTTRFRFTSIIYVIFGILSAKGIYDASHGLLFGIMISMLCLSISIISLAWFLFYKRKEVVFDRNKGTVSIPGPFWYKNVEVPFEEVVAVIRTETSYYARFDVLNLYRPDGYKASVGISTQSLETLHNDWAFYVWYMDKTRALPPAPVFDAYRDSSQSGLALSGAT